VILFFVQEAERDVVHMGMHVDGMPRFNEVRVATPDSQAVSTTYFYVYAGSVTPTLSLHYNYRLCLAPEVLRRRPSL